MGRVVAAFVASALACISAARASDAAPVQVAPADDSIASASQQLNSIRADNTASKAGVPNKATASLALPQLSVGSETSNSVVPSRPVTDQRQQSENWLVDGVLSQQSKSTSAADRERLAHARGTTLSNSKTGTPDTVADTQVLGSHPHSEEVDQGEDSRDGSAGATAKDKSDLDLPEKAAQTSADFNPLDKYMADWLAPQDLALLKSTVATGASGGGRNSQVGLANGSVEGSLPSDRAENVTDQVRRSYSPPTENPYLEFLTSVPPAALPTPISTQDTATATLPLQSSPLPAIEPPKSVVPDFVRPPVDDKYFKPLKRF